MLKVVQHQQHRLVTEIAEQLLFGLVIGEERETDRFGDCRHHGVGDAERSQRNKIYAVCKVCQLLSRRFNSQAGFSSSTWPHQRQQAARRVVEKSSNLSQLGSPPDKRCRLNREKVQRQGRSSWPYSPL